MACCSEVVLKVQPVYLPSINEGHLPGKQKLEVFLIFYGGKESMHPDPSFQQAFRLEAIFSNEMLHFLKGFPILRAQLAGPQLCP